MTGKTGRMESTRMIELTRLAGPRSVRRCRRGALIALLIVIFASITTTGLLAEDNQSAPEAGPDTPVSSDMASPAATGASAPSGGAAEPGYPGAEAGSQVKKRQPVSHEQEEKDRLFVDATFIAVAIILCLIALSIFLSMPRQPKKASNDNQ